MTGYELPHLLVWQCWWYAQKLARKHGVPVTWANPHLLFLLGLGRTSQASLMPSIHVLLQDPANRKAPISGFGSPAPTGSSPLCPTSPPPSHPALAALLSPDSEPPKKCGRPWKSSAPQQPPPLPHDIHPASPWHPADVAASPRHPGEVATSPWCPDNAPTSPQSHHDVAAPCNSPSVLAVVGHVDAAMGYPTQQDLSALGPSSLNNEIPQGPVAPFDNDDSEGLLTSDMGESPKGDMDQLLTHTPSTNAVFVVPLSSVQDHEGDGQTPQGDFQLSSSQPSPMHMHGMS